MASKKKVEMDKEELNELITKIYKGEYSRYPVNHEEIKKTIKKSIKKGFEKGYQEGYNKVIDELYGDKKGKIVGYKFVDNIGDRK